MSRPLKGQGMDIVWYPKAQFDMPPYNKFGTAKS